MVDLNWCKKQRRGIRLIEPNENLSKEYLENAEETLLVLREIGGKSNIWGCTLKYYFEYFCVYSILMKLGIKCEIHDCTVSVCYLLESERILPEGYSEILKIDKQLRIDNQYYLKNREVPINYDKILDFVLRIKDITNKLTKNDVLKIRKLLK